jgi:hypothetical protein
LKILAIVVGVIIAVLVVVFAFIFDFIGWILYFVFGGLVALIYWLTEGRKKK